MVFVEWGTIWRGWAFATPREEDIVQMRQGLAAWQAKGGEILRPNLLSLLAEAYGKTDRSAEAIELLSEALDITDRNGECHYQAELYRLKGEFLLAWTTENRAEAEAGVVEVQPAIIHQEVDAVSIGHVAGHAPEAPSPFVRVNDRDPARRDGRMAVSGEPRGGPCAGGRDRPRTGAGQWQVLHRTARWRSRFSPWGA